MAADSAGASLVQVIGLLAAAVVAVPLFRRLGLGSVLGYLAAGLVIGPFGLGLFADAHAILHLAELGVVMFLFIIGLEMRPSHLWGMRRDIFGLGAVQVIACGAFLTAVGLAYGFPLTVSFVSAMGFVLTSTAVVMQLLQERGDLAQPRGQQIVAVLLFEDMLIVPLLALVALLAPVAVAGAPVSSAWMNVVLAIGSIAVLVAVGLWLLNPLFRILASTRAREVMTAAALLVVLGSAVLLERGGLSMAMGAFLAGVLLSESAFRHQLEADIEPFRGLLLGLFFLAVGMTLDLQVVADNWLLIGSAVIALMVMKALGIYLVARLLRTPHADALDRALLMAQGGEFAFVLFAAAFAAGVIDARVNANTTAIVVLSMLLTPLVVLVYRRLQPQLAVSMDGVEVARDAHANVLIIGFGRFAHIASQAVLARGASLTIIDSDPEVARLAGEFGFKVYFGDGSRLDVLHAAGAGSAQAILVCVNDKAAATRIVEIAKHEFRQAAVLVRVYDREHLIEVLRHEPDFQIRETVESALAMGNAAVRTLGATDLEAQAIIEEVRRLDLERLGKQIADGITAGRELLKGNAPLPGQVRSGN